MANKHKDDMRTILNDALARVNPYEMLRSTVTLDGSMLNIDTEMAHDSIDLDAFERVVVVGAGKAGAPMARAIEGILGQRLTAGLVSVKSGHVDELHTIRLVEAGHPIPDEQSVFAGREILDMARTADKSTLFITLISGGGSALLEAPLSATIGHRRIDLTLDDLRTTTGALLESGATIQEVNAIRKHLSAVKGGRLAKAFAPAHSITLILSDVVGDDLDSIASGVTVPDPTTFGDALALVACYGIEQRLPPRVAEVLRAGADGAIDETPKQDDDAFRLVQNVLVGTNHQALLAASSAATALGYETTVLTSRLVGEARDVAGFLASIVAEIRSHEQPLAPPACILCGGETTVTIRGDGKGGRNQEMALAMLAQMGDHPELYRGCTFLSAATDGTDGPTDAAGAFASPEIAESARKLGLDPQNALARNDSYHFFDAIGELLKTGPTNTNVCDLQIALIS